MRFDTDNANSQLNKIAQSIGLKKKESKGADPCTVISFDFIYENKLNSLLGGNREIQRIGNRKRFDRQKRERILQFIASKGEYCGESRS